MTRKQKIVILLNVLAVVAQVYASAICIVNRGLWAFQYYTLDSNIFSAITSILIIYSLLAKGSVSERLNNFRFYSTCCVTVTFIVVITILVPFNGWHTLPDKLFRGTDLWLHSVGPWLNIISFLFFESDNTLDKKQPLLSLVPTLIYAVIVLILNIYRIVDGPYVFLRVHKNGFIGTVLWLLVVGIMIYGIGLLLKFLNYKFNDKVAN